MSRLSELTGQRQRQLLGVVVGLIVVVVLVVVLAGGGNDEKPDPTLIDLSKTGLQFHAPLTWQRREKTSSSVELRSPDSKIIIAVSSVRGRQPAEVKRQVERRLKRRYAPAEITDAPGRLGERKVASFQLRGRLSDRVITVVGLVEDTPFRTYVVTLFTGDPSVRSRPVADARKILQSFEFFEPGKEPS